MRKFIEFEAHDYMDLHPTKLVIAMDEAKVQDYVSHMNSNYSGGKTRFIKVLTKEEATQHTLDEIKSVIKRPTVILKDGGLDSIDVKFIKKILSELENCYK